MVNRVLIFVFCASVWLTANASYSFEEDDPAAAGIDVPTDEKFLTPTEFIIIGGKSVRLQDGMSLRQPILATYDNAFYGVRINNRTLRNVDFSRVKFINADLSRTRFVNCLFCLAHFYNTNLEDATFENCDFKDVVFDHTTLDSITREQFLSSMHVKSRRLGDFNFNDGPQFKGIDFSYFRFLNVQGINADECCFDNAYLLNSGVCRMTKEQLISTRNYQRQEFTEGLRMTSAPLKEKLSLSGLDLSRFEFGVFSAEGYDFTNVDLTASTFEFGEWISCSGLTKEQIFSTANWQNRKFEFRFSDTEIDWSNVDFSKTIFAPRAALDGDVTGADFTDAKFKGADALKECKGVTREQVQSTWNWKNRNFPFDLSKSKIDWTGADFSNFVFYAGTDFGRGNVRNADFTDAIFIAARDPGSLDEPCSNKSVLHWYNLTPSQLKSTWNNKTGNMAAIDLPPDYRYQFNYGPQEDKVVVLDSPSASSDNAFEVHMAYDSDSDHYAALNAKIDPDEPGEYAYSFEIAPNLAVYASADDLDSKLEPDKKYLLSSSPLLPWYYVRAVNAAPGAEEYCGRFYDYVRLILWKQNKNGDQTSWEEVARAGVAFNVQGPPSLSKE